MSPTISMFYGVIIRMYWEQGQPHHTPHLHAEYQEHEAVFDISNGKILDGKLPRRQRNFVRTWIELHKTELFANWKLAMKNDELFRINPLQ